MSSNPPPPPQDTHTPQDRLSRREVQSEVQGIEDRVKRAERWMIGLTGAIAFFGLCAVIVGFLQWTSMNGQLKEMHQGGLDTHALADAASDQADAAQQFSDTAEDINSSMSDAVNQLSVAANNTRTAIRNAQESFQQEQRAWVGLGQFSIDQFNNKDPFKLVLPWVNSGRTPAIGAETAVSYGFHPSPIAGPPIPYKYVFEKASAIAPQGIYATTVTNSAAPTQFDAITNGTLWMYFFGQFRYHDVHSRIIHTTSFCLYYSTVSKKMSFCENGNDMD